MVKEEKQNMVQKVLIDAKLYHERWLSPDPPARSRFIKRKFRVLRFKKIVQLVEAEKNCPVWW